MHANARLTERCRKELVDAIKNGLSVTQAANQYGVSRVTAYKWWNRSQNQQPRWWKDRSSQPHSSPGRISPELETEILRLRHTWGISPVRISGSVNAAPSTIWRALKRHGLNRKPPTPKQLQARYERDHCGSLIHVDTKRAGRIPDGGGRRVRGIEGYRTEDRRRTHTGHVWFHAAIDDHSRLGYVEVLDSRKADATTAFITRALTWFQTHNIEVEQVMTDNAMEYVQSKTFAQALGPATHLRTRNYRPQTNGKVERFFRTLKDEWLYATEYLSEQARQDALTQYIHYYNHHRPHTSIGNKPPITRVNNLPKQHR